MPNILCTLAAILDSVALNSSWSFLLEIIAVEIPTPGMLKVFVGEIQVIELAAISSEIELSGVCSTFE